MRASEFIRPSALRCAALRTRREFRPHELPGRAVNSSRVADLIQRYAAEPILDSGCGRGQANVPVG